MFSKTKITSEGTNKVTSERRQAKIEKRRRFWRKARKGLLWTLVVAFVAHSSINIYASVQLNRELAAIRQKGEPLRYSEIEPPAVPDSQNAALVYQQATKSLHFSPDEKNALRTSQRNLTPQIKTLQKSALRNNQAALTLTRRAASMPQCRFPLDWRGDPTRFRFPYYAELRELARFLVLDAQLKARQGEKEAAFADVRALFGISHHLSKEPYLIGFLVAQAVDMLAHKALGETLKSVPLSVTEARALEASLPKEDWTRAYRQSLVGERMMGIFVFESLGHPSRAKSQNEGYEESEGSSFPLWFSYPLLWLARPMIKLDEVQTLRMWHVHLDSPESQQFPRSQAYDRAQATATQGIPFYASLTKILFPVFNRASDIRDFAEVRRRQREVAFALTCYRTAQGRYPTQLQEAATLWGRPLPLDIYSQKPFVYRRSGKDFVLYSVGVNRADDGGKNARSVGVPFNPAAEDVLWLEP